MRPIQDYLPEISSDVLPTPPRPVGNCIPNCDICGGIGYLREDVPVHDPRFGKLKRCPNALKMDIEARKSDPRIGISAEDLRALSWDSIRPESAIADYAEYLQELLMSRTGFILLVGPPGQGKTLALRVIVSAAVGSGISAAYANMSEILDDLRRSFDTKNSGEELASRMEFWMQQEVLAVDEYDKANATPWAQERIHLLFDTRYVKALRGEGLTVVASNAEPSDAYLVSRFQDSRVGRVIWLSGQDVRKKARWEWPR